MYVHTYVHTYVPPVGVLCVIRMYTHTYGPPVGVLCVIRMYTHAYVPPVEVLCVMRMHICPCHHLLISDEYCSTYVHTYMCACFCSSHVPPISVVCTCTFVSAEVDGSLYVCTDVCMCSVYVCVS